MGASAARAQECSNVGILAVSTRRDLPAWLDLETVARFVHEHMKPYEDTLEDTRRGLDYALSSEPGQGGFVLLAVREQRLLGVVVVLGTGMGGYVPGHLLLFAAVGASHRNQGIGGLLVAEAIRGTGGDIKVHCEHDNPALRLYERLGFRSKYAELRYSEELIG